MALVKASKSGNTGKLLELLLKKEIPSDYKVAALKVLVTFQFPYIPRSLIELELSDDEREFIVKEAMKYNTDSLAKKFLPKKLTNEQRGIFLLEAVRCNHPDLIIQFLYKKIPLEQLEESALCWLSKTSDSKSLITTKLINLLPQESHIRIFEACIKRARIDPHVLHYALIPKIPNQIVDDAIIKAAKEGNSLNLYLLLTPPQPRSNNPSLSRKIKRLGVLHNIVDAMVGVQTSKNKQKSPSAQALESALLEASANGQVGSVTRLLKESPTQTMKQEAFKMALRKGRAEVLKSLGSRDFTAEELNEILLDAVLNDKSREFTTLIQSNLIKIYASIHCHQIFVYLTHKNQYHLLEFILNRSPPTKEFKTYLISLLTRETDKETRNVITKSRTRD